MNHFICRGSSWVVAPKQLPFLLCPIVSCYIFLAAWDLFPASYLILVLMYAFRFIHFRCTVITDGWSHGWCLMLLPIHLSASTVSMYCFFFRAYNRFCSLLGIAFVLASTNKLCMYAAFLAYFLLPQSVCVCISILWAFSIKNMVSLIL